MYCVLKRRTNMKKLLSLMFALVLTAACSSSENSFKGKEYKMNDADNDAEIILGFDGEENRYFGKVVNNYFGQYEVEGNTIKFGPAGATMMAGPENLMKAESQYLMTLPTVTAFVLDGSKLTLKTSDGKELVFEEVEKTQEK